MINLAAIYLSKINVKKTLTSADPKKQKQWEKCQSGSIVANLYRSPL